jgi:hypothetical protein
MRRPPAGPPRWLPRQTGQEPASDSGPRRRVKRRTERTGSGPGEVCTSLEYLPEPSDRKNRQVAKNLRLPRSSGRLPVDTAHSFIAAARGGVAISARGVLQSSQIRTTHVNLSAPSRCGCDSPRSRESAAQRLIVAVAVTWRDLRRARNRAWSSPGAGFDRGCGEATKGLAALEHSHDEHYRARPPKENEFLFRVNRVARAGGGLAATGRCVRIRRATRS